MPELVWTPPLSLFVRTKSRMCPGWSSLPSTGSSKALPGVRIDRNATPCTFGVSRSAPISQSASSAVCRRPRCLTKEPNTSLIDSLSAPRLVVVFQPCFVLGDPVSELVPDDIHGHREAGEKVVVPVAEDHLSAVPERIV